MRPADIESVGRFLLSYYNNMAKTIFGPLALSILPSGTKFTLRFQLGFTKYQGKKCPSDGPRHINITCYMCDTS